MVLAAILAAGRSSRMGLSKALLSYPPGRVTFLERAATTLRQGGIEEVIVVVAADGEVAAAAGKLRPEVRIVINADPGRGQLSSVVCAADAAERLDGTALTILPVDMPLVRPETVRAVLDAFTMHAPPIARAAWRGRRGHPVIFARGVFPELRRADPAVGAKSVVRAHGADVLDVEVDDPGVLADIDDPETYRAIFGVVPAIG